MTSLSSASPKTPPLPDHNAESGIAILSVLSVLVIITTLIATLTLSSRLDLRRTTAFIQREQAYQYARGAEIWMRQLLIQDAKLLPGIDYPGEEWARPRIIRLENATISSRLTDLQAFINLNGFAPQGFSDEERDAVQKIWKNLQYNPALLARLGDWIDEDEEESDQGAESAYYLMQDPPYLAANKRLFSSSEMIWLREIDPTIPAKLDQHFTFLPTNTKLNINTLPETLRHFFTQGKTMPNTIGKQGYLTTEDLTLWLGEEHSFSTGSNFFRLQCQVMLDEQRFFLETIFQRKEGDTTQNAIQILSRNFKPQALWIDGKNN